MKLVIEKEQAQKILDYLVTKPFAEVHQLIPILVGLKESSKESGVAGVVDGQSS